MGRTKRAVIVGLFLLGAVDARAKPIAGAVCTPGDPAIQGDRYFVTAGSVNYKPGASGLVTLYCHAENFCLGSNRHRLRLTYTDSDGAGNEVSVTAQLLRLSVANGTFLGAVPGAQIFSNFSNETSRTSQLTSPFEFAFNNDYTYVRVDMNRAPGTSQVATLYGVSIECAP